MNTPYQDEHDPIDIETSLIVKDGLLTRQIVIVWGRDDKELQYWPEYYGCITHEEHEALNDIPF